MGGDGNRQCHGQSDAGLMMTEAAAVEDLVQMAINMGELLMLIDVDGLDP